MENQDIKHYESVCRYRKMSTSEFITDVLGIKLLPYQKVMLDMLYIRDRFEQKYCPWKYYWRYRR